MEGEPSLTIEGVPHKKASHSMKSFLQKETFTIELYPLPHNEIPYYVRKPLPILENVWRIKSHSSWESFTIGISPLLSSKLVLKASFTTEMDP
jgi:hypothetical protein